MTDVQRLFAEAYAVFNRKDAEGVLALMSDNVSWPKASEGGRVVGKDEIRAYWGRQWQEFDPQVEIVEVIDRGAGKVDVRVRQVVRNLAGEVLSDSEIWQAYTLVDGLIERTDLEGEAGTGQNPSLAFTHE